MASFITTDEVAARLDMTRQQFYRARDRLIKLHGFPAPLQGFQHPQRYNAHAVICWIRNFQAGVTLATPGRDPGPAEIAALRERLGGAHNVHLLKAAQSLH